MEFNKEDLFIVTGASSGIGQGVALKLNELGASVIAIGRNSERLNDTKEMCCNKENIYLEVKELTDNIDELPNYIKKLKEKYGKFKGLVCCAGIEHPKTLNAIDYNSGSNVLDINFFVPLFLAKGFCDKRNNTNNPSIVFIASTAGIYPDKGQCIYAGSKAGLIAATKSISKEVIKKNIRVNCISPADINTPMYARTEAAIGMQIDKYPIGIGEPLDIANLTAFLLSNKARWITGQNYILDGGAF